jgi:hypothetical protein
MEVRRYNTYNWNENKRNKGGWAVHIGVLRGGGSHFRQGKGGLCSSHKMYIKCVNMESVGQDLSCEWLPWLESTASLRAEEITRTRGWTTRTPTPGSSSRTELGPTGAHHHSNTSSQLFSHIKVEQPSKKLRFKLYGTVSYDSRKDR